MVRQKDRHLLLEIIWKDGRRGDTSLTVTKIRRLLVDAVTRSFGIVGAADILPYLLVRYFNSSTSLCIVKCPRDQQREVRSHHFFSFETCSLPFLTQCRIAGARSCCRNH